MNTFTRHCKFHEKATPEFLLVYSITVKKKLIPYLLLVKFLLPPCLSLGDTCQDHSVQLTWTSLGSPAKHIKSSPLLYVTYLYLQVSSALAESQCMSANNPAFDLYSHNPEKLLKPQPGGGDRPNKLLNEE